jgi:hypothetical protein
MTGLRDPATAPGEPCADVGVTVVIDPNEIGGPDEVTCVTDGGGAAVELFQAAGHRLEYQPGLQDFVCKIDGAPADRPCTEGDSYWSLWWSDPAGEWVYASLGVASLDVPEGGSLGFSWHEGGGDAEPPDVAPGVAATKATGTTATTSSEPADTGSGDGGGFPLWAAALLVVLVLGAAAVVALRRRSA